MSVHFVMPARARGRVRFLLAAMLATAVALLGLGAAPSASAAGGTVSFVAAANTVGNRTSHSVKIPTSVQAGDTLLLFLTTNSTTTTIGATPSGWTLAQSSDGSGTRGRLYTRSATASDAGKTVAVTTSGSTKSMIAVSAYRSSTGASTVTASAIKAVNTSASSHSTPTVPVTDAGSWLVNAWMEKSSTAVTWKAPSNSTVRTSGSGVNTGKISGIVADSNAAVATGTAAARTATTSAAVTRTQLFSVVVSPGAGTVPTNHAPVPAFSSTCSGLTCSFDATASTDADNDALTYSWAFGDGTTGSGATASHAYATAATRTVTLTVSDGKTSATLTHSATTTATGLPVPGHTALAPQTPRTDFPKISDGEIFNIIVVGKRVFVAGSFTSIANNTSTNTTSYNQAGLAAFNLDTGLVDASFRPTFGGGGVEAVAASPDGTKLYAAGNFSSVNGVTRKGVVRLDPTTGAPVTAFTANTDAKATELAATNSTLYVGGKFTKVNGTSRISLAAVDGTTGTVDPDFVNNLSGGIGTNGELTVQRLVLTHDLTKLLVVHTARQVAGQDRSGVALIDVATKKLLPWRTHLWDDNLQFVGGVQRVYGGDISPDDSYFVVTSGSGGDRPPINDTAMAFPINPPAGSDPSDVQPKWITRCFDSVYSVAITEKAVYIGGHFAWNESPTAPDPWPGKDDIGYGTGQGLSAYALGDSVVNREHTGALNPVDGKALEWSPGSNSYEGNKAMVATSRGIITGGDATTQGGYNVGHIAFYDFNNVTPGNGVDTDITEPIMGRVEPAGQQFVVKGTASTTTGTVNRVQVEIQNRGTKQYLQDDLKTWGAANTINATLDNPGSASTTWQLPLTVTGNVKMQALARTFNSAGTSDPTKASKKFETFGLTDAPPTATISAPPSGIVNDTTFTVSGTASDDLGVTALSMTLRDSNGRYLQDDGSTSPSYNAFRVVPDVPGATSTTWSHEFTVPYEDNWRIQVRASDTGGQSSLDTTDRTWSVFANGQPPQVAISAPGTVVPPTAAKPITIEPGHPMTFTGSANDDQGLKSIDIALINNTTQQNLAVDGSWGTNNGLNLYRLWNAPSGQPLPKSHNWSYTTSFDLPPGTYTFAVMATDSDDIKTPQNQWATLTMNAQYAGDTPPKATMDQQGLQTDHSNLQQTLTGSATDDKGVSQVRVILKDADTNRYLNADGTQTALLASVPATVASPGATSTQWTLPVTFPNKGDWNVTAYAVDTAGQRDLSSTGATARFLLYPGDAAPTLTQSLLSPTENTAFTDGRILVSGRAEDDNSMAKVEVQVMNAGGSYMTANGSFTAAPVWIGAFLTSPGTPGSNFSYTTPVVPAGAYTVSIRATDNNDLVGDVSVRHVTVSIPPNNPPVPVFTKSCTDNVCTFDARSSTDEDPTTLTYSWSFGDGTTATGPKPTKTFTKAGAFPVTLTAKDEWGATATSAAQTVTIVEPAGNLAPTAVLNQPSCAGLSCNFSAVGTKDP
jgi:PKD repeat protein